MNFYSLFILQNRSRQSTKTCAECHTYSLVGYGGGILDDIFQHLHLYEVLRGEISKVRAFFAGKRADILCELLSVVSYFSQLCVFMCVFLKSIFFRQFSLFSFFSFHI